MVEFKQVPRYRRTTILLWLGSVTIVDLSHVYNTFSLTDCWMIADIIKPSQRMQHRTDVVALCARARWYRRLILTTMEPVLFYCIHARNELFWRGFIFGRALLSGLVEIPHTG